MTTAEQVAVPQEARQGIFEKTSQALNKYAGQHHVSPTDLLSLLIDDLQNALHGHRSASIPSTSASSFASPAYQPYLRFMLKHTCRNQSVCPGHCGLCAHNPNKRCEIEGDLAPKQLEERETLKTRCGASLQATLCRLGAPPGEQPDGAIAFGHCSPQDFYVEMSLVSAQLLESLQEEQGPGVALTMDAVRQCERLVSKTTRGLQMLKKGADNSENHRVRADFLESRDYASIEAKVTENSQRCLGASDKYRLLVVLVQKADDQPVTYTMTNKFQVTTKRAEVNWNADTPCYDSEVDKLEGCGREISKNLLDVRGCAREKGHGFVPPEGINKVKTVEEFRQLHREMEGWGQVPRELRNALTPEKAVRHAEGMLAKDERMRVFKPEGSCYGALYLCQQAHVDLATATKTGVLFSCNTSTDTVSLTLPEQRSVEQNMILAELTLAAGKAWRQRGHPGWYAAGEEGPPLLTLFRHQVAATGSLEPYTQELAQVLDLPAWIFQPARLQGSGFSQPLPQGGFQGALPQEHQTPQSLPHLPAHVYQQAAWTEDLGSLPADDSSPPETEQAGQFPAAPAGRFAAAPVRQFLTLQAEQPPVSPQGHFSAPQAGQFAAALAGLSAAGPETAPYPGDWAEYEGPSSNGNHYDQQAQPDLGLWIDPLATQGNSIRDLYAAATCNPSSALLGDRQGLSTENGPNSPDEVHMPYTASAQPTPLVLEEASPAGSCQSMPASTVLQQSHSSMDVWTPHPKLASGMQQGLHASGQEPPGLVQGLQPGTSGLGPGSFVFRGRPTQPSGRDRGFMHSQSEKVKRHPLSRTPSFAAGPEPKRRNTAPPDMLEGAVEDMGIAPPGDALVCSGNPASHPASSATVPPSWDTALSMNSHQALTAVPNSHPYGFTVPEYQSLVLPARVERPMQPSLWVLPQFDGAGDQSSGDFSLLSQNGLTNLFAVDDDADSQQLVRDQGGLSQAHHPHMVFIFLAKMRALVARRRHQHGAVADSLALDGWRGRMWQRAVLARFARNGRGIQGVRAVNMNLSSDGSSLALWGNTTGFENDDRHLFDMAAAYLGDCEERSAVGHSVFDELEVQGVSANPLTAGE